MSGGGTCLAFPFRGFELSTQFSSSDFNLSHISFGRVFSLHPATMSEWQVVNTKQKKQQKEKQRKDKKQLEAEARKQEEDEEAKRLQHDKDAFYSQYVAQGTCNTCAMQRSAPLTLFSQVLLR